MDNKFIECPYNKQHKIQRNDIETHFFFKCKAAKNSSIKFKYCQFDNSVFFPKQDEDLHRLQCKKCSENYENLLNQTQISRKIQNEISIICVQYFFPNSVYEFVRKQGCRGLCPWQ